MLLRRYELTANENRVADLATAIEALARAVRTLEGCVGIEVAQDLGKPQRFTLIERWADAEAHARSAAAFPKHLLAPVLNALDHEPAITSAYARLVL